MKHIGRATGSVAVGWALAGAMALSAGCVEAPPPGAVWVNAAPPRAVVEVVGTAPGADMVWIRGYHRWDGRAYVWTPGHWEARPRARARWVDGKWVHGRRGWFWREGHWR
jgi:YXWGXW repeat-containing protein